MESNEIVVSIVCEVFNHEQYLERCLQGFVMQKTNFKYEILIHDDASTDGSVDVLRFQCVAPGSEQVQSLAVHKENCFL